MLQRWKQSVAIIHERSIKVMTLAYLVTFGLIGVVSTTMYFIIDSNLKSDTASVTSQHLGLWLLLITLLVLVLMGVFVFHPVASRIHDEMSKLEQAEKKMEEMNAELLRLNEIKSNFTSMLSHELRTPLNAIKESIQIVLDGIDGPITEEQQKTLSIATSNVNRLTRLINNVLHLNRLESGKMGMIFERTTLNDLISTVCQLMQATVKKKNLELTCTLPSYPVIAICDSDKIQQLLINLIDNAMKFTPQGGITITLATTDHQVKIGVADTGVGIPPEEQDEIFDMFSQGRYADLVETSGAGIGLTVCKQIIAEHHGTVHVQSEAGKGTTFTIQFPMKPA